MNAVGPGSAGYTIRQQPDDFVVIEEPLYLPSGEGGHTFLYVEKRGRTTEAIAGELARVGGCQARDVGYAGRKDRHALTRQWFSLPAIDPEEALEFEIPDAIILEARRHQHKLKTGQLRRNRFEIILRGRGEEFDVIQGRADALLRRGMPNRFGKQRFGQKGDNARKAQQLLESGARPRDRRAARFLISALQSEVFNAVLDERADAIDRVELGDLARVEESGGLFWVDDLDREIPRASAFEITATGPIFGTRTRTPRGEVARLEREVYDRFDLPSDLRRLSLPRGIRARGGRRPLRIRPTDLRIRPLADGEGLRLECALPPGAYVTVLLDSLVGAVIDGSRSRNASLSAEAAIGSSFGMG